MPGGDDDDDIEDMSDEEQEFGNKTYNSKGSKGANSKPLPVPEKFIALYDDAKHRNLR